ncbi:MAG: carboxypeptidase-like regulatory domain-containing protein, partial [Planctomycetaceae bacterium]
HLILDHPFMAVSDANGKFEIEGLPAGKHEFTVWHEKKGYLDKKLVVEVKAGESKSVDLKYGAKQFATFEGPKPKSVVVSLTK